MHPMTAPPESPQVISSLQSFIANQADKRAKRRAELKLLVTTAPISDELLSELVWMGRDDLDEVLFNHPGHSIQRKLESLWRMLAVFEGAYGDVVRQLDAFDAFSRSDQMRLPGRSAHLQPIETALNKELVAFSAAAGALVYFSRRLRSEAGMPSSDSMLEKNFDPAEHKFVIALRNAICHVDFPDVSWRIEYRDTKVASDFVLSLPSLRQHGELPEAAMAYLSQCPQGVRVRSLVTSYSDRVLSFYSWYRDAIEGAAPPRLLDYRRVVKAWKAHSSRTMHRVLLNQFLARNIDPYEHLQKYLTPAQIEMAMALPFRSKAQVDFIIEAADEYQACDSELRAMIYRLFGMNE